MAALLLGSSRSSGLPYDIYLDLSGIGHLVLDPLGYVTGHDHHVVLTHLLRDDHDADLTSCLYCKGLFHALVGIGYVLKLLQPLGIGLQ